MDNEQEFNPYKPNTKKENQTINIERQEKQINRTNQSVGNRCPRCGAMFQGAICQNCGYDARQIMCRHCGNQKILYHTSRDFIVFAIMTIIGLLVSTISFLLILEAEYVTHIQAYGITAIATILFWSLLGLSISLLSGKTKTRKICSNCGREI